MKRWALVLLAACAAFAAQALPVDWNKDVPWGDVKWRTLNIYDSEQGGDITHLSLKSRWGRTWRCC